MRSRYVPTPVETGVNNGHLIIGTRPRFTNLLQPNHFNKILAGNCSDRLRGEERPFYDRCADFAYLTAGDSRCTSPETQELRNQCNEPGNFTGAIQPE